MSEEFSDDFVIEEEEDSTSRNFLVIAGSLIAVFILIVACVLVFALLQRGEEADTAVAEIEATNDAVATQNSFVTLTVQALETEAARPTSTPTVEPTVTSSPTPTATTGPTNTPVVQQPGDEATVVPTASATTDLSGGVGAGSTPTPLPGGSGSDTLPQTGVSAWGIVAASLGLLAVLIIARRLRTG